MAGIGRARCSLLAMVVVPAVGSVAVASDPIFHLLSKKWGQAALREIG